MPRSPRGHVLALKNLAIRRGVPLLQDVTWRVRRGEHWVLLGPNGSGKTSLLSALAGYCMPSEGTMTVLGRTHGRTDWRDLRARLGIVSTSVGQRIDGGETAMEAVVSGNRAMINLWGGPSRKESGRALALLRRADAAALADRPWRVLSQGERQRVLIARALMADPRLLILDEPCAGLDPVARENFLDFLNRLARRRGAPAVLFATHHVEEIRPFVTHALVLRRGRVVAAGPLAAALSPENLSTAFGARLALARRDRRRYALSFRARRPGAPRPSLESGIRPTGTSRGPRTATGRATPPVLEAGP